MGLKQYELNTKLTTIKYLLVCGVNSIQMERRDKMITLQVEIKPGFLVRLKFLQCYCIHKKARSGHRTLARSGTGPGPRLFVKNLPDRDLETRSGAGL